MHIFQTTVPTPWLAVAPRTPYPDPDGKFSWQSGERAQRWGSLRSLGPATMEVQRLTAALREAYAPACRQVLLIGFSQGAAFACALAAHDRADTLGVAMLARYVPLASDAYWRARALEALPVFWAHGTDDPIVPLPLMESGAKGLESAGALLSRCQAPAGHKLAAPCLRSLSAWLGQLTTRLDQEARERIAQDAGHEAE